MKNLLLAALALGIAGLSGVAIAQTVTAPQVQTVGPKDLIAIVPNGQPTSGSVFATPGQIAGVPGYVYSIPTTGFTLTFGNSQTWYVLNPAGTLATGTFTMAANPSDGQRACVFDSKIQTAVTFSANTGQSIANAPTAQAAADWTACFTYVASIATWERSQ